MFESYNLEQFTVLWVFHLLLIFCRVGSGVMLIPGVGEVYVPAPHRLLFALLLSFVLMPFLTPSLPPVPGDAWELSLILMKEIIIGIFIGLMIRMMLSLIHVAGMIIAFQSSLASALLFDINQGNQGSVVGAFMTLLAVTILFTSDMHHLFLKAIAESYNLFAVGAFAPVGDFSNAAAKLVSEGFLIGFKIASPVLVVTLILFIIGGVMSRLMPNMQIFFVVIPIQIIISFLVMAMTLSVGMMWWLEYYQDSISFLDATP